MIVWSTENYGGGNNALVQSKKQQHNNQNRRLISGIVSEQQCKLMSHGNSHIFINHLKASFSSRLQVRLDVPWIQVSNAH